MIIFHVALGPMDQRLKTGGHCMSSYIPLTLTLLSQMLTSCARVCSENEQLAFSPGIVVPGIAYSEDKLLQTRIFSYSDTQRYRLGGNYLQLPVNMPKCPHHNNHHDGLMNTVQRAEEVNYFPSRNDPARHAQPYPINAKHLSGQRERRMISKENNFQQVRSENAVDHAFDTRGTCLHSCWTPAPNYTALHNAVRLHVATKRLAP